MWYKITLMKIFLYFCLISVFTPLSLNAQIIITEIMYDMEGSDSGREWVEIFNNGGEDVDVSDWWFFEGSNHGFQNDGAILGAGAYAVVVDDIGKFTSDFPSVTGLILDSSAFSLKNTGEYIAIKDIDKNEVDGLSFIPLSMADGQGSSLQLVSGVWVAYLPTPGAPNNEDENTSSSGNTTTTQTSGDSGIWIEDTKRIYADAGIDRTVFVGADSLFEGEAQGFTKEPIENARYIWNFGDGEIKEGQNVLYAYKYPGEYTVFLDVVSGKYTAHDRIKARAVPAEIQISNIKSGVDGFLELHNLSKEEINLSWWRLRVGNNHFTLPEHTYILPDKKVIFSADTTGLSVVVGSNDISLLYPNGEIAVKYQPDEIELEYKTPQVITTTIETQTLPENKEAPISFTNGNIEEENTSVEQKLDYSNTALASIGSVYTSEYTAAPLYKWLLALLAVILLSAGGIIFIANKESQKRKEGIEKYNDIVREIQIIDES